MKRIEFSSILVVMAFGGCGGGGVPVTVERDLSTGDMATTTPLHDMASPPTTDDMATMAGADLSVPVSSPSFEKDVRPILTNHGCFSHHMTNTWDPVEKVSSSSDIVHFLSTTQSSECSAAPYVKPGDATNSYLYQKVTGAFQAPCAPSTAMPPGGGPLPVAETNIIKAWISAGAAN